MSGARLARGVAFNLAGVAVPAVLGLLAMPALAQGLGTARLGILTLAWALLGYLSLLHLGVGRALTHAAAGRGTAQTAGLAWTGVAITGAAGLLAGTGLFLAAAPLADGLKLPPSLRAESVRAFRLLACALPFTVAAPALTGLLEARGRWGRLNVVGGAVSAASYLGPLAVVAFGGGLPAVAAVLAGARAAGWLAYLLLCLRELPEMRRPHRPAMGRAAELLRFGGWTTVSAVASPLMVSMDRFVVAAVVSSAAVAYYAAPQEVVLRMGMVSSAVGAVLFPAFAAAGAGVRGQLGPLLQRGTETVFVLVFPLSLLLVSFAGEGLGAWLGAEYARAGAVPLAWLGAGLLANGLAKPPAAMVVGIGRPELAARLHLVELPLYAALLAVLVPAWGIRGAAVAWVARAAADAAAMHWTARRLVPDAAPATRRAGVLAVAGFGALAVAATLDGAVPRIAWVGASLLVLAGYARRRFLPGLLATQPAP